MFTHLRSLACTAGLLLSPAFAAAQVYLPGSAPPVPGSALANTSQVYYYFNGVPYYQGFYYPGPQANYPGPLDDLFRTPLGLDIPSMIVISPPVSTGVGTRKVTTTAEPVTTTAAGSTDTSTLNATLDISLPAQAELYVQGKKTSQTGSKRHFTTPPLDQEQRYQYRIKATWSEDGQDRVVERTVILTPGVHTRLSILGSTAAPNKSSSQ